MGALEEAIRENSRAVGFSLVGIAPATPADDFALYQAWVADGFAGEMHYMSEQPRLREHPSSIFPTARSVIMMAMDYAEVRASSESRAPATADPAPDASLPVGKCPAKISRYAVGRDYHSILRERLQHVLNWLKAECPDCEGRCVVDTAPLLERDFARRAGLGWIGKNTMLINKRRGSYFFLGAILTNLDLEPDSPHRTSHCGTCTACLDACPTSAFVEPGRMDARKCISYLTIELRGSIPENQRDSWNGWIFGCDICQEVCPWNRHSDLAVETVNALELAQLDESEFHRRYRGTALQRTKRAGLVRNALIHLANHGPTDALSVIEGRLDDPDPMVRDTAWWAFSRLRDRIAPE
jgi:epoxyqueuosine reductase